VNDVKTKLRTFIDQEVLFGDGGVTDDQDLLGGVLDSLALLQFVEFIEGEFDIEVNDEDMVPDNFRSIDAIAGYVASRTS
jgi:acyl carrier protein